MTPETTDRFRTFYHRPWNQARLVGVLFVHSPTLHSVQKRENEEARHMKRSVIVFLGAVVIALGSLHEPAYAQTDGSSVSASEVASYASAQVAIEEIAERYRAKANEIESDEELAELQAAFQQTIRKAIKSEGLSVMRYNEIFEAARSDDELARRIISARENEQAN